MLASNFFKQIRRKIDKLDLASMKSLMGDALDQLDMLKTVFNSMNEGVLVLDKEQKLVFCNKMAISNLSLSQNGLNGESLDNIIGNEKILEVIKETLANEEKLIGREIKVSESNYISLSIYPLVKQSKIIGTILIVDDISISKENELKLQRAENLSAVTTISAGIAHEIKNPLSAMSIHVQLLQDSLKCCKCEEADDMKYSINVVGEEIARLSEIVNNFLFAVRPIAPTLLPLNINEFLDKFARFIMPQLKEKNILLVKNYSDVPEVLLDEKLFKQALLNLTQNSIAAMSKSSEATLEFESVVKDDYVYVNIIDNGCGIPEELQSKIFNPYFTTKSNGTGLGLTILYKIIKEHNGEISFTSVPGRTVFSIKLPMLFVDSKLLN